jgi:hypothetical protein
MAVVFFTVETLVHDFTPYFFVKFFFVYCCFVLNFAERSERLDFTFTLIMRTRDLWDYM